MGVTKIEWTDETWNPMTGCIEISPGCNNCYAKKMAKRLNAMGVHKYRNIFKVTTHESELDKPMKWKKSRMVFVNSMGDLFHDDVSDEFILKVFTIMNLCPSHTFQVLTKRPERVLKLNDKINWTPNIWMGVSVESFYERPRVVKLEKTDAKIKFISFEPLIDNAMINVSNDGLFKNINWAIVGGETGSGARIMKDAWVEKIFDNCKARSIPFFFKGIGTKRLNKKDPLYRRFLGREWNEMPEVKLWK